MTRDSSKEQAELESDGVPDTSNCNDKFKSLRNMIGNSQFLKVFVSLVKLGSLDRLEYLEVLKMG